MNSIQEEALLWSICFERCNWEEIGSVELFNDFVPERLDASYIGEDGKKYRPVMLHLAISGFI